jgi:hypothetical protein
MPDMVKEYFAAIFQSWVGKMSGPAAVLLVFLPLLWPSLFGQSTMLGRATWVAAAICLVIANYSAWKHERDKYEREASRNEKPEIRGKAWNFRKTGMHGDTRLRNESYATFGIDFDLTLSNHRPATTNLANVSIAGSLMSITTMIRDVKFQTEILAHGIAVVVSVSALVSLNGVSISDLKNKEIALDRFYIGIFDGFGIYHPIPIPDDETICFDL